MSKSYLLTIGHLGKDSGAVSPYDSENPDSIALQQERFMNQQQAIGFMIALLADNDRPDIKVAVPEGYMTNLCMGHLMIEVPDPFTLGDRVKLANSLGSCLVELHNNAGPASARGAEAICYSKASSGYKMGQEIMSTLSDAGIKSRGTKTMDEIGRSLYILKATAQAALIMEGGFVTNESDQSKIDVDLDSYNEQYGYLVYKGLKQFHTKYGV